MVKQYKFGECGAPTVVGKDGATAPDHTGSHNTHEDWLAEVESGSKRRDQRSVLSDYAARTRVQSSVVLGKRMFVLGLRLRGRQDVASTNNQHA